MQKITQSGEIGLLLDCLIIIIQAIIILAPMKNFYYTCVIHLIELKGMDGL